MAQSESIEYIQDVCRDWLGNADLYELNLAEGDGAVLKFVVGGTEEFEQWVDVRCRGVHVFNVSKDPEDSVAEGIFVGGARVLKVVGESEVRQALESSGWKWQEELPEQAYQFEIEGGIEVKVICTGLEVAERKVRLRS
jgi:hypothetical protein